MCGIIGMVYGPEGPDAEEWTPAEMAQMMFPATVHRGPHAWGWMSYSGGDSIDIFKMRGRSDTKQAVRSMAVAPDAKWWVGHVRYYTNGSPSYMPNNHPVSHGNILGVHNGVIRNHDEILSVTGREDPKCEVDSEAIFASVHKWGHQAGLGRIRGDMVTVYVDRRYPDTVRFGRTIGRPLTFAWTPKGSLIFASEPGIIDVTGIEHTEFSNLSSYRLLNVKAGKVIRRVDLPIPRAPQSAAARVATSRGISVAPVGFKTGSGRPLDSPSEHAAWYRPHHSESTRPSKQPNKPKVALGPRAEMLRQEIIRRAQENAKPRNAGRVRRTPNQSAKVHANGVIDAITGLYWCDGSLVDLDTWVDYKLGNIDNG